jgi:hypothetical protein
MTTPTPAEVRIRLDRGETIGSIAASAGRTYGAIRRLAKQDPPAPRPRLPPFSEIEKLLAAGFTKASIARRYRVSPAAVSSACKRRAVQSSVDPDVSAGPYSGDTDAHDGKR